jgi:hypothetical protein
MDENEEEEYNEYYNLDEFKKANEIFEDFLSHCDIKEYVKQEQSNFVVSTMTITSQICDEINVKVIYERINIDNDIQYIEFSKDKIKGMKNNKKKIYKKKKIMNNENDKRKKRKGNPFSNQISIGVKCDISGHEHNNPICMKIFKNGKIQMTGCKDENEVLYVYGKIFKKINELNTEYFIGNQKVIISPVKSMKLPKELDIKLEMINGTFRTNFNINLNNLFNILNDKYKDDVYISYEKKSPLRFYLKKLKITRDDSKKIKNPTIFVYNSGSVNIISVNKEIFYQTYEFISNLIKNNYDDLIDSDINIDYEYLEKLKSQQKLLI